MDKMKIFRGSIFHLLPTSGTTQKNYQFIQDGLLLVQDGKVKDIIDVSKASEDLIKKAKDFRNRLIMPGLIDGHVHYPQTMMLGSYGEKLLEWLEKYTFPEERKFQDQKYAEKVADVFFRQLLKNGTTTAATFSTVHADACETIFSYAEKLNFRLIAGKVMMDRNAPNYLLDTPQESYLQTKKLIEKWHGKNRLNYAVTPRFAPTSTEEQLKLAGKILKEHSTVYMQTHLSENLDEIKWVKSLFPDCKTYLSVYEKFGLVGDKCLFGHGIHLEDSELKILKVTQSKVVLCPSSNLFLGSGLYNLENFNKNNISVLIGTDVGAGTSFSLFESLKDAYKICQLQGQKYSALDAFYQVTLGAARSLGLESKIGNFEIGKEADFIVVDFKKNELLGEKWDSKLSIEELLFGLIIQGNDQVIESTYLMGQLV